MSEFTTLERVALQDICQMFPGDRKTLEEQFATATIKERKNSGAGFFTRFEVSRDCSALRGERLRSGGWLRVDGLKNEMGFVLWLTEGYADCLEGFTIEDSTEYLDLAALKPVLSDANLRN